MTTESYSKWLIKTKDNLGKVREFDNKLLQKKAIQDRSLANHLIGGLYSRYSMVVQELDACLDHLVQVQKGFTVRKITNAAVARLNELKEELTKIDISEYHYIDGALIELKLIPHDVEIIHSTLVHPRDPQLEICWKKLRNDEVIYEKGDEPEEEEDEDADTKKVKKKKVKIDPLALLNATQEAEKPPEPVEEVPEVVEEIPELVVEEEEVKEIRSSMRRSSTRIKKKRPCLRPKIASQLEAEMSTEEKEVMYKNIRYSAAIILIQAHERSRQARLYVHDLLQSKGGLGPVVKSSLQQTSSMSTKNVRISESLRIRSSTKSTKSTKSALASFIRQEEETIEEETYEGDEQEEEEEIEEESSTHRRESGRVVLTDPLDLAACKIQSWWRGILARDYKRHRELRLRLLIGMVRPSYKSKADFLKFKKSFDRTREARYDALREYYQTLLDEKARVLRVVAPGLFEDIGDEIRQWFRDWYYSVKQFKDIPSIAEGGTILVVRGEVESPEDHAQEMQKNDKKKGGGNAKQEAAKKAAEEKKKKEEEKKKKEAEKAKAKAAKKKKIYEFEPTRTAAMNEMDQGFEEYNNLWNDINDADNPQNKPYMEVITEQMCYEVQLEVRPKVDELMRLELEILKNAVQKDKWLSKKGKKGAFKPKKEKKPKGAKGAKGAGGKKGKKKKDPTGKRKVEDLFQELYQNGIIRKYPEVHLNEYISDFSYQNYEQREELKDPPATLGDARQAVIMSCIVPLGVEKMPRNKSVLLTGPRGCGLDILANAVFNETQCVLFDLSPQNVKGKYPGKKGNKDLTHLVTKMSRLLQPSIIYIENCEKTFYKKVPKDEREDDPKRVSKFIAKIIKPITQEDRILVLGTSYYPFLAQAAKIKKTFQRIILIPRSDYGSLYIFWEEMLLSYHGVDRNFNCSALATMTRNYPLPEIKAAVERVLVPKRIIEFHFNPLEAIELIDSLRDGGGPVTDKEWEKYTKFYAGTKLGKARKALNAENLILIEAEKKKAEQAAKKKK